MIIAQRGAGSRSPQQLALPGSPFGADYHSRAVKASIADGRVRVAYTAERTRR